MEPTNNAGVQPSTNITPLNQAGKPHNLEAQLQGQDVGDVTVTAPQPSAPVRKKRLKKPIRLLLAVLGTLVIAGMSYYGYVYFVGEPVNNPEDNYGNDMSSQEYEEYLEELNRQEEERLAQELADMEEEYEFGMEGYPDYIDRFEYDEIDWSKPLQKYRDQKLTVEEVEEVTSFLGPHIDVYDPPDDSLFTHRETYKGIEIKWTDGRPIPAERLQWIKNAIDNAPDYYVDNYPIAFVYAIKPEEYIDDPEIAEKVALGEFGNMAAASGPYMILYEGLLYDTVDFYADADEMAVRETFYHEWTHIVQYYEAVATFTNRWMVHELAGARNMFNRSPFVWEFGQVAGWYYRSDDWPTPELGEDEQSQKTTDYGTYLMYEDQADTFAYFFTCNTAPFSEARLKFVEDTVGESRESFCN